MATVSYKNIKKSFGSVEVIPDLNLEIRDGEFLVLVGPSGCGKTTALRMLAGLEEVTAGQIDINGQDVTYVRPGLRNCAMVFQNYALYPHMTVRQNIAYGMKVRREDPEIVKSRVGEASSLLGLDPYLDRKPRDLSGGQRQRVAIGRAIVRHPQVFLFDEPLSNLDAKLRVGMRSEIRQLQRRLGTTTVYVTHDQVEAMTMADRVVVMNAGRIEQMADPITLYEKPTNRFVANFIGSPSMNFFEVEIDDEEVVIGSHKLLIAPTDRSRLALRQGRVIFGIRPEHMRTGAHEAYLGIVSKVVEPLGSHTILIGDCAGISVSVQVDSHFPAVIGEICEIPIDMAQAHYFDPESGLRI